jgi:hypothetical protein
VKYWAPVEVLLEVPIHSKHWNMWIALFVDVYRFQEDNVGQSMRGTKWGALGNMFEKIHWELRNLLGTHWELDWNTLRPHWDSSVCICVFNYTYASSWLWSLHDDAGQSFRSFYFGKSPKLLRTLLLLFLAEKTSLKLWT